MSALSVGSYAWFGPVGGGGLGHGFKVCGDFPVAESGTGTVGLPALVAWSEDDVFLCGDELDRWERDCGDGEGGFCGTI